MKFNRESLAVYFILGSQNVLGKDPLITLEQALTGGITCFQFREKGSHAKSGREKLLLAQQMQELCLKYQVPFFINDDVELAIALDADGLHVGQEDQPIDEIRKIVPEKMWVGLSTTSVEEAVEAQNLGVDYIGVGPIHSTKTKSDSKEPIGIEGLSAIRKAVPDLPIVAIGGVKIEDVLNLKSAGADGAAVISAISHAKDPVEATRSLKELIVDV